MIEAELHAEMQRLEPLLTDIEQATKRLRIELTLLDLRLCRDLRGSQHSVSEPTP